jgi:hypothetical protein
MKKQFLISFLLLFISYCSFAQMEDGTYTYENAKIKLTLVLTGDGQVIESAIINHLLSGKKEIGKGIFMSVEQEEGPSMRWYQFQTEACDYEFDCAFNTPAISLSSSVCKNGIKPAKYILKQK